MGNTTHKVECLATIIALVDGDRRRCSWECHALSGTYYCSAFGADLDRGKIGDNPKRCSACLAAERRAKGETK